MRVSKLIKRLQELQSQHGDLPVYHCGDRATYQVGSDNVEAYGEGGVEPDAESPAVEIFIH